jgi:amino acid transporter
MASEQEAGGLRQKLIVPEAPSPLFSSLFGAPARLQASPPPPPSSACEPAAPERTLGALGLALFCFASIAGGPYGIENSVGAIGALPTMLALVGTALAWSLTQALMAAELSSMFPSNSGYILWVLKGLGPTAGFVNAWLGFCMGVLNLPMYTGLAASAVDQVLPLSEAQALGLQVGLLALGVAVNIAGLGAVEKFTGLLVVVVQVPFVLMPIAWAAQRRGFEWQALGRSREGWSGQLGPALAIVCWNSLGWNCVRGGGRAARRAGGAAPSPLLHPSRHHQHPAHSSPPPLPRPARSWAMWRGR